MRQYKSRLLRLMMILIVMVCTVEASGGIGKASSDNATSLLACIQFSNKGVRGPTIMRGRGYCMPDGQPTHQ